MKVGPSGSPCRRRSQTAAMPCRSSAGVGSDCGKGPQSAGQVSDEKTNMVEPLLTHRDYLMMASKAGRAFSPGAMARLRGVPSARELPVCCLLYTSDAADEEDSVDLGGRRIIKKKKKKKYIKI